MYDLHIQRSLLELKSLLFDFNLVKYSQER